MNIQPFEVHIPDIILYDLQERLADIRGPMVRASAHQAAN
jgi:hypothetical protein